MLTYIRELKDHFDVYYPLVASAIIDSVSDPESSLKECSHLLFYGPPGGLVMEFTHYTIARRFGLIYPLKWSQAIVNVTGGSSPLEVVYSFNQYCIDINLTTYGQSDKLILSEILKPIISQHPMGGTPRHVVILRHVDMLSQTAQLALRRMMELFSDTCLFIMTAHAVGRVPDPLKSRTCLIRCPCLREVVVHSILNVMKERIPGMPKLHEVVKEEKKEKRQGGTYEYNHNNHWQDIYCVLASIERSDNLAGHSELIVTKEVANLIDTLRRTKTPWNALEHVRELLTKVYCLMETPSVLWRAILDPLIKRPEFPECVRIMAEADYQIAISHRATFALEAAFMKLFAVMKKIEYE
jgi:DNA polymerase III delta prime subunit